MMLDRARFELAKGIGYAICEPKLRLGRRRHDGHCDHCGGRLGPYAMEKLDFPLESLDAEDSSPIEKLRAMFDAEYVRVCLECSVPLEAETDRSGGAD